MNSFNSRLGFKVNTYFAKYPSLEEACKQYKYESKKSKAIQKGSNGLQYHLTIPRLGIILYDHRIYINENINVFKDFNEIPPSDDCFSYEYIDAKDKNKLDEYKGKLAGDAIEKNTKNNVGSLNHATNWLGFF